MPTCVVLRALNSLEVQPCSPPHPCSIPQPCPCSACGLSSTSVPGSLLGAGGGVGEELQACLCSRFLQREEREGPQSEAHSALLESYGITDGKGMSLCPLQRCLSDVLLQNILLCILSSPSPLFDFCCPTPSKLRTHLNRFALSPGAESCGLLSPGGSPKRVVLVCASPAPPPRTKPHAGHRMKC